MSLNSVARSSLEKMLESLQQSEDNEKPKDIPPVLPVRPKPTPRARLPSPKRRLPTSSDFNESGKCSSSFNEKREASKESKIGELRATQSLSNGTLKEEDAKRLKQNTLVSKKGQEMEPGESPNLVEGLEQKEPCLQFKERDNGNHSRSPPPSHPKSCESEGFGGKECSVHQVDRKPRVWCRVEKGIWESGQIQSTSEEKSSILLMDGCVVTVCTQDILPANPDILEGVDDLKHLSYLNEPSILHNLQHRYLRDRVYSKAGRLLLAVNPFKDIHLYGNDIATAYKRKLVDSPHVYTVADAAYNAMMADDASQSIIISGESGAGKTETAKIALQYLALSGSSGGLQSEILQTSCILEAFGNAKTSRNDNSSRFGKLVEIYFSAVGEICGAKIQTFLLEKSRVIELAQGERSYHIFYQLCDGAPSDLRDSLRLKKACDYSYLNQSDCLEIHGVDDAKQFHILMGALNSLKIGKDDQANAFAMLAAVLWLGNISFVVIDNENHIEVVSDEAVANAAALIGCRTQELMLALSTHSIVAGKDKVSKRLVLQQATDRRDSLAMFIYGSLFDWLVEKINESLAMGNKPPSERSISILDIFGFESVQKNGFEQLCINYANERLQQNFNRQVFKIPQEEYKLDGINWTRIDFEDNQDCLDLFEKKPLGFISLLDEESKLPKATDLTLAAKLKQHFNGSRCFKGEQGGAFRVRHYAGEVLYDTMGFLQNNRDTLPSENLQLLSSCTNQLPQLFASVLKESQTNPSVHLGMLAHRKQTVATKFKDQLYKIMQQLDNTTPHFIHCIKPNSNKIPGAFEKDLVSEQLRCCGVLKVIRISKSGYPIWITHQKFSRKYGCLLHEDNAQLDPLSKSVAILRQVGICSELYQVGFRKLFFRAGQMRVLEKARERVVQRSPKVQKYFRGHYTHQSFHDLEEGIVTLQSLIRGWLARRHFSRLWQSKQSSAKGQKQLCRTYNMKDQQPEMLPSVVEKLQKEVSMAKVALGNKEKENAALREQVQQLEARWSGFQSKMKSMEKMWQKQVVSLQMSLDAAHKTLDNENTAHQSGKLHGTLSSLFSEPEDTSLVPQTPDVITPARIVNTDNEEVAAAETNEDSNPVSSLAKEFEQIKHSFNQEAQVIAEVKSDQSPSADTPEELQRLKHRFDSWSKDFKFRLKSAKTRVIKLGHADPRRPSWKWWGKKNKRLISI
ncbi:myosin-2-like isoform X2 [Andrographis paniculata]|uniref:myosin-2-like isoform X2 n=1 Tax=Andrographis paniculata TaxID=175694 RepID=UPI0021E84792|nr:myosin-2-like isoform X2 [Andrographis paniculata]